MIGGDYDHIPAAREIPTVLIGSAARANGKTTAVTVKHDRALAAIGGRCPDVEEEAVLGRHSFGDAKCCPNRHLQGWRSRLQCIANACPGTQWSGGLEAIRPRSRAAIRDALEGLQITHLQSANAAVGGFDLNVSLFVRIGPCQAPRERSRSHCC